jgi:hypothetical protein
VKETSETYDLSIHRACGLFDLERSSYYHVNRRQDDVALRMRLKELPPFGCGLGTGGCTRYLGAWVGA